MKNENNIINMPRMKNENNIIDMPNIRNNFKNNIIVSSIVCM